MYLLLSQLLEDWLFFFGGLIDAAFPGRDSAELESLESMGWMVKLDDVAG